MSTIGLGWEHQFNPQHHLHGMASHAVCNVGRGYRLLVWYPLLDKYTSGSIPQIACRDWHPNGIDTDDS